MRFLWKWVDFKKTKNDEKQQWSWFKAHVQAWIRIAECRVEEDGEEELSQNSKFRSKVTR